MTATGPLSSSSRKSLADAGLEDLAAVDVGEEALQVVRSAALFARFQARDGGKDAEEFRTPRRQLGGECPGLRHMRAIAAVGPLANAVDRDSLGRHRVGRIDQSRIIEVVRHGNQWDSGSRVEQ